MKFFRMLLATGAAAAFALPAAAQQPPQNTAPPAAAPATRTQAAPADQSTHTGSPVPATAADLQVGRQVLGPDGMTVGTIAETDGSSAVIRSAAGEGRLHIDAFYRGERGIIIGYSSAEFDRLVEAATAQGGPADGEEDAAAPPAQQPR